MNEHVMFQDIDRVAEQRCELGCKGAYWGGWVFMPRLVSVTVAHFFGPMLLS